MSSKRIIALLLSALIICLLSLSALSVREGFQYSLEAPKLIENQAEAEGGKAEGEGEALDSAKDKNKTNPFVEFAKKYDAFEERNLSSLTASHLEALSESVEVSDGKDKTVSTALVGLYGYDLRTESKVLSSGRYFYPEELKDKKRLAVIDEALAVELFRISDPIGRKLFINKVEFEVIGVVKRGRLPSDIKAHHIYLPFLSLNEASVQPKIISANIGLKKGLGGETGAKKIFEEWEKGGTLLSLSKEKIRTLMPLRLLICFALSLAAIVLFNLYKKFAIRRLELEKERLKSNYAQKMLLRWFGFVLLYAALLLLWVALLYLIITKLLEPVYLFPEWVPSVIVEPKALIETFYNNRAFENKLVEIKTEQLIYLRFLRNMLSLACAFCAMLLIQPYHKLREMIK